MGVWARTGKLGSYIPLRTPSEQKSYRVSSLLCLCTETSALICRKSRFSVSRSMAFLSFLIVDSSVK